MGFWGKIKDASPHKSHARANEVHQAGIKIVNYFGSAEETAGMVCPICKATIGAVFAKDRSMHSVMINNPVSFYEDDILIVCNKCVEHFHFG